MPPKKLAKRPTRKQGGECSEIGAPQQKRQKKSSGCEPPAEKVPRLTEEFYDVPCEELAKNLLGKVLARKLDTCVLRGRIVETEAYLGEIDKASMTYNGRVTDRMKPLYMKPGTTLVYMTYGMYHCMNISSQGEGAGVLLRALEPISGQETMLLERLKKKKKKGKLEPHELCNGPSKLCTSLCIDRSSCSVKDLSSWEGMWIEEPDVASTRREDVVTCPRVGIDAAGREWAQKALRFYLQGNECVSRVDRAAEEKLVESPLQAKNASD